MTGLAFTTTVQANFGDWIWWRRG